MAKPSVGLLVMTEVPNMGLCAVLQVRGTFNTEKMAPESYPGGCQVTVHGKVEANEVPATALHREILEELGPDTDELINAVRGDRFTVKAAIVIESKDSQNEVMTYAVKLECSFLKQLRFGPDSGGLRLITRDQIRDIEDLRKYDKKTGVLNRGNIAMFPDEREAVRKAFELFL